MARVSQKDRILSILQSGKVITSMDAYKLGITQLGARIFELKKVGYNITATWVKGSNRGKKVRYVQYRLVPSIILATSLFLMPFGAINAKADDGCTINYIPQDIAEIIEEQANARNLSYEFCVSLAYKESCFDTSAENNGCIGLFQINPEVHKNVLDIYGYTPKDMYDAEPNTICALTIIENLFEQYEDAAEVLMRYNGARTALKQYHTDGSLNYYTNKVLSTAYELESKNGKH